MCIRDRSISHQNKTTWDILHLFLYIRFDVMRNESYCMFILQSILLVWPSWQLVIGAVTGNAVFTTRRMDFASGCSQLCNCTIQFILQGGEHCSESESELWVNVNYSECALCTAQCAAQCTMHNAQCTAQCAVKVKVQIGCRLPHSCHSCHTVHCSVSLTCSSCCNSIWRMDWNTGLNWLTQPMATFLTTSYHQLCVSAAFLIVHNHKPSFKSFFSI